MKKKIILFLFLMILFLALLINYSQGEGKNEIRAFANGNIYLNLTEIEKMGYLKGLIDMLLQRTKYCDPELYSDINDKTKDMTLGQRRAIFDKYLEEHPEKWHQGAAGLFWNVMMELIR